MFWQFLPKKHNFEFYPRNTKSVLYWYYTILLPTCLLLLYWYFADILRYFTGILLVFYWYYTGILQYIAVFPRFPDILRNI